MKAIDIASEGLEKLNTMRNIIGIEVRNLRHIADELNQERINLMAAASTIGDADFSDKLTALAKSNILQDSARSTAAVTQNINLETTQNLVNERLHTDLNSGYTKYRAGMY